MRISTGWLSERYSTTTVHNIGDPNYLGISLLFHPLPLDSETASDESVIRITWDEEQLQCWVCK